MFTLAATLPAQGQRMVEVPAKPGHKVRQASVSLGFRAVTLPPPRNGRKAGKFPLLVWEVRVWEPDPPEGEEALEWILPTMHLGSTFVPHKIHRTKSSHWSIFLVGLLFSLEIFSCPVVASHNLPGLLNNSHYLYWPYLPCVYPPPLAPCGTIGRTLFETFLQQGS